VAQVDQERLQLLEAKLGATLPPSFTVSLGEQEPIHEGSVAFVTTDRVWSVRTTFALDSKVKGDQLDRVYALVGDVMPPGALPFAEDWAGNFYCLMLSGPRAGQVVYWDHERDAGDNSVVPVSESVAAFYAGLVPDPQDGDA
jgi:cell wall assembly regulator SMI1